jgi:hypothetical protein
MTVNKKGCFFCFSVWVLINRVNCTLVLLHNTSMTELNKKGRFFYFSVWVLIHRVDCTLNTELTVPLIHKVDCTLVLLHNASIYNRKSKKGCFYRVYCTLVLLHNAVKLRIAEISFPVLKIC